MNPINPTTPMTKTRANEYLSDKAAHATPETLRQLAIFGIENPESSLNKAKILTAEFDPKTPSQEFQVNTSGQNEVAYIEKIVFVDQEYFVMQLRTAIAPKLTRGISRTFFQKTQQSLPRPFFFLGDTSKKDLGVYSYLVRIGKTPEVFELSTPELGFVDIQVTAAETIGEAELRGIYKDGTERVLPNLNVKTQTLKKIDWDDAIEVKHEENVNTRINMHSTAYDQVITLLGTDKGIMRQMTGITEMIPSTEGMQIVKLWSDTSDNTIWAWALNENGSLTPMLVNNLFSSIEEIEVTTYNAIDNKTVPVSKIDQVQVLKGAITTVDNQPGILVGLLQEQADTDAEQSHTYDTHTLPLYAAAV